MKKEEKGSRLTTLCYVERGDAYLMLHRVKKEKDVNRNKWIGIGGHAEAGESPEECIRREAMEETGLVLKNLRFRGIVTFCFRETGSQEGSGNENAAPWDEWEYMCLFTAETDCDLLQECDEGELAWIEKERMKDLELWEGDKIFLRLLKEDAPFFSLKLCYNGSRLTEAALNGEALAFVRT